MLHTLNRAWVKILAKHENAKILFVFKDLADLRMIDEAICEIDEELGKNSNKRANIWVYNENEVREQIKLDKQDNKKSFRMYDDILISHEIHDNMLHDFLGRHCKRKCC